MCVNKDEFMVGDTLEGAKYMCWNERGRNERKGIFPGPRYENNQDFNRGYATN